MRVFSFSVLFQLSEVGKAESNDEGQFPGIDVAEEEYDPAFEYLGTEDWTEGISVGTFGDRNVGMTAFNKLFSLSSTNIVRRLCSDCSSVAHREIYYKRLTPVPAGLSMYDLFYTTWGDITNRMHVDFDLYSSFDDALNEVNPWTFCNYNDPGVGFPRDCGPAGFTSYQWNTDRNSGQAEKHPARPGPESYQFSISRVEDTFNLCGKQYYTKQISTSKENYAAAKTACVNVGAQLPDICSSADLDKLVQRYGTGWWVAANDIVTEKDWRDFKGDVATGLPWNSGEPNNSGGEDCAEVLKTGLNDQSCNDLLNYICVAEVDPREWYKWEESPALYENAEAFCRTHGGDLCEYEDYCRDGVSFGGPKSGDHWAPYKDDSDEKDTWVEVGDSDGRNCWKHHEKYNVYPDSWREWGMTHGEDAPFKGWILCCNKMKGRLEYVTKNAGDAIKLTYYKNGLILSAETLALEGSGVANLKENDFDKIVAEATGTNGHDFSVFNIIGNKCSINGLDQIPTGCTWGVEFDIQGESSCNREEHIFYCQAVEDDWKVVVSQKSIEKYECDTMDCFWSSTNESDTFIDFRAIPRVGPYNMRITWADGTVLEWTQVNHPLDPSQLDQGQNPTDVKNNKGLNLDNFSGLSLSSSDETLLDGMGVGCKGCNSGFWWYAIGANKAHDGVGVPAWVAADGSVYINPGDEKMTLEIKSLKGVSCMNDHWTYNEDTEQCEPDADLSSIACGSTDMTISIHKAFVYEEYDGDVPSKITIGNKDCTSTWDSDNMAVFKVNFNDECGQDIYHENGTISVSIDFNRSSSKEVDGVGIFTSNEDNMIWTFTCSYDDVISTKDSLEVSVSALIGATTLHTVFPADVFLMKLVNVDNPNDPIKNGDMTRLTIQMPEGFPKNLKLHFMTCTATADGDDSITIKMVKDGCALDVIDSADASTSENAISYTYTAFSFSEFGAMEIICDAKICLDSEVRKECMEMEDTCAEGYTDIF